MYYTNFEKKIILMGLKEYLEDRIPYRNEETSAKLKVKCDQLGRILSDLGEEAVEFVELLFLREENTILRKNLEDTHREWDNCQSNLDQAEEELESLRIKFTETVGLNYSLAKELEDLKENQKEPQEEMLVQVENEVTVKIQCDDTETLTKREQFALAAMLAIIERGQSLHNPGEIASMSFKIADSAKKYFD
jgi:predicted nuclease with TOPRIM domain